MKYLMNLIWCLALVVLLPKLLYRRFRFGRYKTGWAQRFGNVARRNPQKKCIWLHAVSVGEVNATKTLISGLRQRLSDYELVMSVTTDTGFAQAIKLYGDEMAVFYYPYDFSWVVTKALGRINPAAIILMELEVWPNMAQAARHMGIPIIVANGRLSEKSLPKYRMIKWLTRRMFSDCSAILVQTKEYAGRFIELGAPVGIVKVTGSLKYDTAEIVDTLPGADVIQKKLSIGPEPLWVAGGTGDGEEAIILKSFAFVRKVVPSLRLAIVPRKPERFNDVAQLIERSGFEFVRYSQVKNDESAVRNPKSEIILVDTMGDLRKFYSLASVIFVGRSLVPMGGSDMIEAAALGKPTIFGPHTFNFSQDTEMLLAAGGAILVRAESDLSMWTSHLLISPKVASDVAAHGRDVIRSNQGATARTIEDIARLATR
jgi:3-deoxy-D-manno-octulosonic-acid transferase